MKKSLLIKIHLYAGLFTTFYLMAFGFSSIVLNHELDVDHKSIEKEWTAKFEVDTTLTNNQIAELIRYELGIMGWLPGWEMKRSTENFSFTITHFGRKYFLDYQFSEKALNIKEQPKGFLAVFHGLHFLNGKIPNAPFIIQSWAVYQWLALLTMFISMVVGIWLWIRFRYQRWQGALFAIIALGTIILFAAI